ncbi:Ig-like domain-containing protein [Streptomyces sp. JH14]|uniref:L,D-transpeptidase n=1 Tax=Streptomyces sp. JH14 TaxID=2793630 RepID=UPI0023F7B1D4|nr:Ig-like domain-containing protein [Streptomyces sp. JH14]MDF6044968.1 Ig-like domain-containing protein [Streptomyces sp. JH14]
MNHNVKKAGATLATVLTWAGLLAVLTVLTGCTGTESFVNGKPRSVRGGITIVPRDGARDIGADARVEVKVPSGRLESVKVTQIEDARRRDVRGKISQDGLSWAPHAASRRLSLSAKYTVDVVALDGAGHRTARHTTFTTAIPEHRFTSSFTPDKPSIVGTGMIVSFRFDREIRNRAAVERAIRIRSVPAVAVVGHWFGGGRLDFRPAAYWKPGTKVTVAAALRDVPGAPHVYGTQQKTVTFTVGRSQVSRVDVAEHTMEVRRNGRLVDTVPVTAGAPGTTTYNGKMVVTEMHEVTRMDGRTVGFGGEYDIKDVPHALRLTASGTFLHGNYWAGQGVFGSANVSHGCVGLQDVKGGGGDTPAGRFYDQSRIGDVVEVVNSEDKKVAPDNGLGGWNLNWSQWKAGSALH